MGVGKTYIGLQHMDALYKQHKDKGLPINFLVVALRNQSSALGKKMLQSLD